MFRTVPLSIIRSFFTVHTAVVYVIQLTSRIKTELFPSWSCSQSVSKPVWHIPLLCVQWKNSWWWTEELSETYRVLFQKYFEKLVHLFVFIIRIYHDERSPVHQIHLNKIMNRGIPQKAEDFLCNSATARISRVLPHEISYLGLIRSGDKSV